MRPIIFLCMLAFVVAAGAARAQTTRHELWRGVWISLPKGAVVEDYGCPIPEVLKLVRVGDVFIQIWRQRRGGLPYGAAFERRWRRSIGHRQITMRERGNSYWASYIDENGDWSFNRKIRMSSKQMVEAYFSVSPRERSSKETRRKRKMIMSIALRKK